MRNINVRTLTQNTEILSENLGSKGEQTPLTHTHTHTHTHIHTHTHRETHTLEEP